MGANCGGSQLCSGGVEKEEATVRLSQGEVMRFLAAGRGLGDGETLIRTWDLYIGGVRENQERMEGESYSGH